METVALRLYEIHEKPQSLSRPGLMFSSSVGIMHLIALPVFPDLDLRKSLHIYKEYLMQ